MKMSWFLDRHLCFKSLPLATFRKLCKAVDTPKSLEWAALSDREIAQLQFDPELFHDCDAEFVRVHYLLISYLSKFKGLRTNVDTEEVALRAFQGAEDVCQITNARLKQGSPAIVDPIIHRASRLIAKLLGEFSWSKVHDGGRWGPGATHEFPRTRAYMDTKMLEFPITVTRECMPLFAEQVTTDPLWARLILGVVPCGPWSLTKDSFSVVPGSRITTVPKNAKTDRTIAVEPRGNMFIQKAFGSLIRQRLRSVGVNLDDQSINQDLAKVAFERSLSTIDLKAASDTVCLELVYLLLPVDWAMALDRVRSKSYTIDGETYCDFHKFSSMGNGFTFELESMIFWALTQACHEACSEARDYTRTCAVYGDDIVCGREAADLLICSLNYCGFTVNADKSFLEGNFFESCGRHFWQGDEVTPVFQKNTLESTEEVIRFYNRLKRWSYTCANARIDRLILKLFGNITSKHEKLPLIPIGVEGDDGFVCDLKDLTEPDAHSDFPLCCIVFARVRVTIPVHEDAHYVYTLRESHSRKASWKTRLFPADKETFTGYLDSRSIDRSELVGVLRKRDVYFS